MPVRYLTPAREEFLAVLEYYEAQAPGLGSEFDAELVEIENRLLTHPASGTPFIEGTRRALLGSFPYSVIYRATGDEILIIAVAHQRRRPGYWKDRIG